MWYCSEYCGGGGSGGGGDVGGYMLIEQFSFICI